MSAQARTPTTANVVALTAAVEMIAARIKDFTKPGREPINEANTKNWLIEPLLQAMGWDTHDPKAVAAEYRDRYQDQNPVDYALLADGAPALFLEAKALGTPLTKPKAINQVVSYGNIAGVQWVIITDGNEYHIFRTDTNTPAAKKLLTTLAIVDESRRAETLHFLGMLHRETLALDELIGLWGERDADEEVRGVLAEFLSGANTKFNTFVARHTSGLSKADVARSLQRATVSIAYPKVFVPRSYEPLREPEAIPIAPKVTPVAPKVTPVVPKVTPAARKVTPDEPKVSSPAPKGTHPPVATSRLDRLIAALDADGATWPVKFRNNYHNQEHTAEFNRDGTLTVLGVRYTSFNKATIATMFTVNTNPPAVNGWAFWKYTLKDGRIVSITDLAPPDSKKRRNK